MTQRWRRLVTILAAPADAAGLAVFRVLFGALIALGSARFLDAGWPEKLYGAPRFLFRYAGFEWVPAPTAHIAALCYGAFVILGLGIAIGALYRCCIVAFVVLDVFVQLGDVTTYLNHAWLVVLLGAVLCVVPAHQTWSVDAWLWRRRPPTVPRAALVVLQVPVACVYIFAAVAKVGMDWLAFGQPLSVWLPPRSALPLIGPVLVVPWVPLLLSWGGFVYDATIVPLLLWRRTRIFAYVLVVVFHGLTRAFFEIGMFPFIMMVATTLMFTPSWPRGGRAGVAPSPPPHLPAAPRQHVLAIVVVAWCALNVAVPLRCFAIADNVLWDEAGMRFSWRVMLREKSGALSYRVTFTRQTEHGDPRRRTVFVSPHDWLTWRQANEMVGQPDLILQLAHAIRDDFVGRGATDVEVRADCAITFNGRPAAPFIDPDVDLARQDTCVLCRPRWVLPSPSTTPPSPLRSFVRDTP